MNSETKTKIQNNSLACKVQNSEHLFMDLIKKMMIIQKSSLVVVSVNWLISTNKNSTK